MGNGKYLGLPSMIGRNKKSIFSFIKDRIWKKIQNWNSRSLSRAGKEVLIKAVAQAVPSYCMGAFLLPTTLGEEIERMMNSFYWGTKKHGGRGINWLRWDKMTTCKENGGLKFRDLEGFNLAMLGKQGWKLITNSSSLLTRVLKAKYFPRNGFLEANIGHNPSYTWRSIQSTIPLLTLGYRWKIGDGSNINVWSAPWIRSRPNMRPTTAAHANYANLCVSDLFDPITNSWNHTLIASIFNGQDTADICRIPLHSRALHDSIIWKSSPNGNYTVKSAYKLCLQLTSHDNFNVSGDWRKIWTMQIPPKLKHFCWRMLRYCLPTRLKLHIRGVNCQTTCAVCSNATEDELRLFFDCPHAISCWKELNLWQRLEQKMHQSGSFSSIIFAILADLDADTQARFVAILWSIWRTRNDCLWEHKQPSTVTTCRLATDIVSDYTWCCNMLDTTQSSPPVHRWKKPEANWLKCNVDGAIFSTEGKFGIGICFRNDQGILVQAHTMYFPFEVTLNKCEASTPKHTLLIALSSDFERVVFETDSQIVINSILNG
jgi:hypothetical protein